MGNGNSRTGTMVMQLAIIIVLAGVMGFITYEIGGFLAKSFLGTGGISRNEWLDLYFALVRNAAILSGVLLLAWYVLAQWGMRIRAAKNVGRRMYWALIGIVSAVLMFLLPFLYRMLHHSFATSPSLSLLFVVCFTLVVYWVGSLLVTPAQFKYTPLGGLMVHSTKKGK